MSLELPTKVTEIFYLFLMMRFEMVFFHFIYFWVSLFTRNSKILMLAVSITLFLGLMFNYTFDSSLSNAIFVFTAIVALFTFISLLFIAYGYKVLWFFIKKYLIKFEFEAINHLDKEQFINDWILISDFYLILNKKNLLNFICKYYSIEILRANSELFLKILSDPLLIAENRANLVDAYFAIFTYVSLNVEPHRELIFHKIIEIKLPFNFSSGVESYYNLFVSQETRRKMYERGWHHRFMYSLLGKDYYKFECPLINSLPVDKDFNEWYLKIFGNKPALRKIIQEKIIDKKNNCVKWSYFKFLQAFSFFNFNYDILLRDINFCLNQGLVTPFDCPQLFMQETFLKKHEPAILYLKNYYGDTKMIKLLRKITDRVELDKVLEIITDCLNNKYNPSLPKKIREWKDLVEYAKEEQKKAQQFDFSLEQFAIYDWEDKMILNYTIWIPRRNFKLIRGGTEMHNCVGNGEYARRVVNKNSFIMFLKKGKKTQVCIELKRDDLTIRCIKGLYNNDVPAGVTQAVEKFINDNK